MTPVTALAMLAALGYVRYCPCCEQAKPFTAFELCTPSVNVDGEPYGYEHRRRECASCRARRLRVGRTPLEEALEIVIPIRPAREYRRVAA